MGEVAELGYHYWHGHCAGNCDPANSMIMDTSTSLSIALYTVTALLGVTLSYICRRGSFSSLRKREREEGPSFEPDSKRAKLDDETTSSSNPVAPEPVPEPEAPLGEELPGVASPAPQLADIVELPPEELTMVASPGGTPDFNALPDLIDLGSPDVNLDVNEFFYNELCESIYLVICNIISKLPLILPDPHRVTLFEIVRFSLFDEEEEDLFFLQEILQDLSTLGSNSEFFQWVLKGLQESLSFC